MKFLETGSLDLQFFFGEAAMISNRHLALCYYQYDPLDRLANYISTTQTSTYYFYQKNRLTTEIDDNVQYSIFQQESQLLAQQIRQSSTTKTIFLATDLQRSVLSVLEISQIRPLVYTPYGHLRPEGRFFSLLGFNGERLNPVTMHYLLGNGYRAFNPTLMRFNSPDSFSPFEEGGVNPYVYCLGDPINRSDPNGKFAIIARLITSVAGLVNSGVGLAASIPFKLGRDALWSGAAGHLPLKYSFGAASSVATGTTAVLAGVTGVASATLGIIDSDSPALKTLAFMALGLSIATVAARVGVHWVARDLKAIPALKNFVQHRARSQSVSSARLPAAIVEPSSPKALSSYSKTELFSMYENQQRLRRNAIYEAETNLRLARDDIRRARRTIQEHRIWY